MSAPAKARPVLDFTGGFSATVAIGSTFGWQFAVGSPLAVAGLGVFDIGADGLASGHAIGLWASDGTLLRSAVITNANSTPVASTSAMGNWRAIPVPTLTLDPGAYVIGATYVSGDADLLVEDASPSAIPGIGFGIARLTSGAGLLLPLTDEPNSGPGYFGPNIFTPSELAVPEPSSFLLLGTGALGIAALMVRATRGAGSAARRRLAKSWHSVRMPDPARG